MKEFQIVKSRNIWLTISAAFLIPGIIALFLGWLKPGLDFVGGTLIELKFEKPPEVSQVIEIMTEIDKEHFKDSKVQPSEDLISIRSKAIDNSQQTKLFDSLKNKLGKYETMRVEVVGPTIGSELFRNSMIGFILVFVGIIGYISFRFKFDYAICAIIALLHDVVFLVGTFALFGKLFGTEVDSLFVTAALTVAGFSVHDTIVVFDRVRENLNKAKRDTAFEDVANDSLNQTLARSINTSLTTLITLTALYFFGGESIKDFTLAMIIGIAAGTYSSIFVATPLLVIWREKFGKAKVKTKTA